MAFRDIRDVLTCYRDTRHRQRFKNEQNDTLKTNPQLDCDRIFLAPKYFACHTIRPMRLEYGSARALSCMGGTMEVTIGTVYYSKLSTPAMAEPGGEKGKPTKTYTKLLRLSIPLQQ